MRAATIVIDALLGTGLTGMPRPPYLDFIHQVNQGFPAARVVAVDIPSGMHSDTAQTDWPHVRAHHTVTFTAPKVGMVLEPNASARAKMAAESTDISGTSRSKPCASKISSSLRMIPL